MMRNNTHPRAAGAPASGTPHAGGPPTASGGTKLRTAALRAALLASLWVAAACSGAARIGAADVQRLERAAAATPADAATTTELGIAYYHAGRYEDARATLRRAPATGAHAGSAALYLGLASEQLEDWAAARAAYESYLETARAGRPREQVRQRLAVVARQELQQQARAALAQEQQLSTAAPTPRSIAVFPFELIGASPEMQPLQAALADMVITDLGLTGRLISIERAQVRSLLDEMVLAQAGFTAPETGARAGRLLRAEHVVQGRVDLSTAEQVRLDAAVLTTVAPAAPGMVERGGPLNALFDLEKQLVFGILDRLNIQLTPAERRRIDENRAANLIAFLTYGAGLDALDRGDYAEAARLFEEAARQDPDFPLPQTRLGEVQLLVAASAVGIGQVAATGLNLLPRPAGELFTETLLSSTMDEVNDSPATGLVAGAGRGQDPAIRQTVQRPGPALEPQRQQGVTGAVRATIRLIIPARPQQ